ncbi:hypothetical protein DPMN_081672 [Dreissena polymorpha]|uniref:DUF6589 domain-containing protein n=1 Tax=Dreissena polymorpha TaxID=45954 RepID=A0A9D3Y994_DREPO|nr:hypothetical protein DPMN_081672 [Dreissena polymorpha]
MHHAFGSAVIIQNTSFEHLPDIKLQIPIQHLNSRNFLPTNQEYDNMQKDFAISLIKVAANHIPFLKNYQDVVPENVWNELTPAGLNQKNHVIPLPVLHRNEQKYDEVVDILDFFEDFLTECYNSAGVDRGTIKTHIGGDQLTRERFSGAKRLRAGGLSAKECFERLSPITFEMFHLLMNYVKLIFKQLYNENSTGELGTMKCEATRIFRTSVNENVNENYDADKDFIVSYVDAYIVEAVMDYFGMDDPLSSPTRHCPLSQTQTKAEKQSWVMIEFCEIVKNYVWAKDEKTSLFKVSGVECM